MLHFPLDQYKFKARAWYKARYKPKNNKELFEIPPDNFIEIRETLSKSPKEDAKLYLEDIYKMIIRWCNDDSTLTNSDSDSLSLDDIDKGNKDTTSNPSLSSCETDLNLSRTKRINRKQRKRKKKMKKKKNNTLEDASLSRIVEKTAMITSYKKNDRNSNHDHSKERVNDNLVNLDNNIVENITNLDNGVPLDEFHDALYQSIYQYLPTWNTGRKVQDLMHLFLH